MVTSLRRRPSRVMTAPPPTVLLPALNWAVGLLVNPVMSPKMMELSVKMGVRVGAGSVAPSARRTSTAPAPFAAY
jgi:hypothetical protein